MCCFSLPKEDVEASLLLFFSSKLGFFCLFVLRKRDKESGQGGSEGEE